MGSESDMIVASDDVATSSSVSSDMTFTALRFAFRFAAFPVERAWRQDPRLVVGVSAIVVSCSSEEDEMVTVKYKRSVS